MNPEFSYTLAMPWYERADFAQLMELANGRRCVSHGYDAWRDKALSVAAAHLAKGRALQLVTIKPDQFLKWLESRGLPNTTATRLRYVEHMAIAQLSVTSPEPSREAKHAHRTAYARTN